MDIHPGLMSKIKPVLLDVLRKQRVQNGIFLDLHTSDFLSTLDETLPQHGPLRDTLNELVDDAPLSQFVSGWIHDALSLNRFSDREDCQLSDLDGFENLEEVADRIIRDFHGLPYEYKLTTALPESLRDLFQADESLQISKDVRIFRTGPSLRASLPLTTNSALKDHRILGGGLLGLAQPETLDGLYIQINAAGYIGPFAESNPKKRAYDLFRSFFGICIALVILQKSGSWRPQHFRRSVYIHRRYDDKWCLEDRDELDLVASTLIDKLERVKPFDEESNATVGRTFFDWNMQRFSQLLNHSGHSDRILLAAQWLFDSYAADNELLAFVQAMVCLEIIFGEQVPSNKTISLGELLRNRCAYLIGKTASQRTEILAEFGEIYDVRSAIVHRGKSRISRRERMLFNKLRWYCSRSIQEEIELLAS